MQTIEAMLGNLSEVNLRRGKYLQLYREIGPMMKQVPASTKYHHCWEGGLHDHTEEVMAGAYGLYFLYYSTVAEHTPFSIDDVIISAFIHDLDKLDKYAKKPDGTFEYNPNLSFSASPIGKTMNILASHGISLTDIQLNALTYAEGGWSQQARTESSSKLHPLACLIHMADMASTYFMGHKQVK